MTPTAPTAEAILRDAIFPALRDHIISATGLVFYADRPESLAGHVGERMIERGLDDCRSYLSLLKEENPGSAELDKLVELLTIGETYFFRHRELFDALRDAVLPEIIGRNGHSRRLRIWSAGCANGAEVYSLAIVLRRDLSHLVQGWNISIVGTDINRTFLAQAAVGDYEEWAFRGTPPELRRECFQQGDKTWRIARQFREGVSFHYHNLVSGPFPATPCGRAAFDLILCRNVLIYFGPDFTERVISQLAECLAPEGWLAVGHAEHGTCFQAAFEAVSFPGAILYRKSKPREAPSSPSGAVPAKTFLHGAHCTMAPRSVEAASNVSRNRSTAGETPIDLQQIRALADRGNIEAALRLCQARLTREPLNPIGYFYEALLLDLVGQHAPALRSLQKAIYLDRKFALAHYYSGLIREKLGLREEALTSFRNVAPLIAGRPETERLPEAEGLAVADLQELTRLHIAELERT
jgi:chemotaxis protein methyltransferase CheR